MVSIEALLFDNYPNWEKELLMIQKQYFRVIQIATMACVCLLVLAVTCGG